MTPYEKRIFDLLATIDSPLVDNERLVLGRGLIDNGAALKINYDYVTEKQADVRLSTSEHAKLRLALMCHHERSMGWDFLAELAHLDREDRELALRVLDMSVGTGV